MSLQRTHGTVEQGLCGDDARFRSATELALDQLCADVRATTLQRRSREICQLLENEPSDTRPERFKLFDRIRSLFIQSAHSKPLVVIIDDLHAADESSLLLWSSSLVNWQTRRF